MILKWQIKSKFPKECQQTTLVPLSVLIQLKFAKEKLNVNRLKL